MQARPDGKHKKMEKYILRKAFDDPSDPYLPESVLWRQKEQFSDGVGYSWVDGLKEYAQKVHSITTALCQDPEPHLVAFHNEFVDCFQNEFKGFFDDVAWFGCLLWQESRGDRWKELLAWGGGGGGRGMEGLG